MDIDDKKVTDELWLLVNNVASSQYDPSSNCYLVDPNAVRLARHLLRDSGALSVDGIKIKNVNMKGS